jgi:hypothetical protein
MFLVHGRTSTNITYLRCLQFPNINLTLSYIVHPQQNKKHVDFNTVHSSLSVNIYPAVHPAKTLVVF